MEAMNQDDNTLIHTSHLHALRLMDVDAIRLTEVDASPPECHACSLNCTGSSFYQCAPCRYVLHLARARAGKTTRHPGHPEHLLSLHLAPPYENGFQVCDACQCRIGGHSFHREPCRFDLHLPCAALPDAATLPAHPHPLKLTYEDPLKGDGSLCLCNLCGKGASTAQWFYWCEECDFAAHVGCAVPGAPAKQLYPAIDVDKMRAEEEAAKTAALLQQYQQMSALISAQSSVFASNTASIAGAMQSMAVRASDHNLEINFNRPRTEQENRKREEFYARVKFYARKSEDHIQSK